MTGRATVRARIDAALARIRAAVRRPLRLMEVCGTHTMAIGRHGLRSLFPPELRLLSGPGCPVCVTPGTEIDQASELARRARTTVATFGDMLRVPGARGGTLDAARAEGASVRVVYSALDAVELARRDPGTEVVFVGVGFETTSPTVAAAMKTARRDGVGNFSVLPSFKLVPPAMIALGTAPDVRIEGFLCPGHVSTVIGARPYEAVAASTRVPCVIAGFAPTDILEGVAELAERVGDGRNGVYNGYAAAVREEGNPTARALLDEVFEIDDAAWRGIGVLPRTGLRPRPAWVDLDARRRFGLAAAAADELPDGCSCGLVMRGVLTPPECPLFGRACTPVAPVGPCMVSSEGACAAYHKYEPTGA